MKHRITLATLAVRAAQALLVGDYALYQQLVTRAQGLGISAEGFLQATVEQAFAEGYKFKEQEAA